MKFNLDGLDIYFPYENLYPEQLQYMASLKQAIDAKGHAVLEMPTGTGKTVCLLSLIISYKFQFPKTGKLIYCTRTVPEMVKCMDEVKSVLNYRQQFQPTELSISGATTRPKMLAICLSARRNLCINKVVMQESDGESVDSSCRARTASWVRENNANNIENLCSYYDNLDRDHQNKNTEIPIGVYSLEDLKEFGSKRGWCPYFLTRYLINHADIIVFNYQYLLDPKVANLVSRELEKECITVFDEAHNIDNVCIEALSVILDSRAVDASIRSVHRLQTKVTELKAQDSVRLQNEYRELMSGLISQGLLTTTSTGSSLSNIQMLADNRLASPLLSSDIVEESIPGSIRKAEHFVAFLKKIVLYFKNQLKNIQGVELKTPLSFLNHLHSVTALERKPLKFTYSRLNSLLKTLEITSLDEFNSLTDIANFVTLVSTYNEGFSVIIEPLGSIVKGVSEPLIQLACLDSAIAIKPVFDKFVSVIITSGTLSPIGLYSKLLSFNPVVAQSFPMSVFRSCLLPIIVTRGSDQQALSTKFSSRNDDSIARNYGQLLIELCSTVPDGICCFFPSYMYMEAIVQTWERLGLISQIIKHKLIFLETKDIFETTLALDNFKRSCDSGKGALFLSISRGKVAEGVDFDRHYGRCVVVLGVPYQYTQSISLNARLDFLRDKYQIRRNDFLTFDALRQSSQCVGRVIRSKTDYGIVILADSRFAKNDKRNKFPPWVLSFLKNLNVNVSTEVAIDQIKGFLRQMGQPIDQKELSTILMNTDQVMQMTRKSANVDSKLFNVFMEGNITETIQAPVLLKRRKIDGEEDALNLNS